MHDPTLTDEQRAIADMAREFGETRLRPGARAWEEAGALPFNVLREAASLGMAAITVPEAEGGSGLSRLDAALIFEGLSRGCPSVAAYLSIHNMAAAMIARFGTAAQREARLPSLVTLETVAAYCLTEPGSGSDAAALRTRAVRAGDAYILEGEKAFISGAGVADLYLVMARTGEPGPRGISCFLVDKDTPGLSFGAPEAKMGWRAQPTAQVRFDGVRVGADALLGGPEAEGCGFGFAMAGLDGGRLNIAACSLGGAAAAFDAARAHVVDREAFGQRLADFQSVQFTLADIATDLAAGRALLHQAARALDAGAPGATATCAMAKRFVTDSAFDVADKALQLHGGYGYLADYGVEKILRDLRVHRILEGANEIMRVIIARELLADPSR